MFALACELLVLLAAFGAAPATACRPVGDGDWRDEERSLAFFNRLAVSGDIRVHAALGDSHSASVSSYANLNGLVETSVAGGVLRVHMREGACASGANISLVTTEPFVHVSGAAGANVSVVEVSGSVSTSTGAAVEVRKLKGEHTSLTTSNGASVSVLKLLTAGQLSVSASDGGRAAASGGKVGMAVFSVNSGASVDVAGMEAESVQVFASAGTVYLPMAQKVSGSCDSDSKIFVAGSPSVQIFTHTGCMVSERGEAKDATAVATTGAVVAAAPTTTTAASINGTASLPPQPNSSTAAILP